MIFHKSFNISFTKLALISSVFFFTQSIVDFLCIKIADLIGYRSSVIIAEITSAIGLAGLGFLPSLFNNPFVGILICVVIYAIGSGLTEVLVSPIIEACPFENKEGAMSILHSFYCWGSVGVIVLSTLFFIFY